MTPHTVTRRLPLIRAISTVGGLTMVSRVTGFIRDILTAAILGAGPVADAFFVALKLPNLFRRLFAEGAFSVSFVPLFARRMEAEGLESARLFANQALAAMVMILVPFTILAIVAMPWIVMVLAPGFAADAERYGLAVEMARITFPYLMMMSIVALLGGVLNSIHRFGPFAAAPIAFNLSLIAALLLFVPVTTSPGHALSYGVAAAGVIQLVWLAWECKRAGLSIQLPRPRLTPGVRRLFRLMAPGALGAGAMQINIFVDVMLASLLPTGAVSYLYYADRLNQLPLGIVGIAIGTALLPVLSRCVEAGDRDGSRHYLSRSLEFSLFLGLPAAIALIAIPGPIIQVLFERGAFGAEESRATALALMAYAIGIPGYILVKVLNAAFFAREDTTSPVKAAIAVAIANIVLALALIVPLGHVGIALATGLTAWLQVSMLALGLKRLGLLDVDERFRQRAPRIVASAVIMGVALGLGAWALGDTMAAGELAALVGLAMLICGGGALYLLCTQISGASRLQDIAGMLRRRPEA